MPTLRSVLPALLLILAVPARAAEERARLEPTRATKPPVIDGVLDDEAWQGPPLALGEWLTYNPLTRRYRLNDDKLVPIFPDPAHPNQPSLTGFRKIPHGFALDWGRFIDIV